MEESLKNFESLGLQNYKIEKADRINRVGDYFHSAIVPKLKSLNQNFFYLEIGSGHGHWLTSFASNKPNRLFIGIDLISKRVRKAESKKSSSYLSNLFFIKAEASEFIDSIPNGIHILSTFIMFPDPWPKKRHFKNRLIQNHFLTKLAKSSTINSRLYFRTDHQDYFDWTVKHFHSHSSWEIYEDAWPHDSGSYFQGKFEKNFTCCAKLL